MTKKAVSTISEPEVGKILRTEKEILHKVEKIEETESKLAHFEFHRRRVVHRLAKHRFVFSVLVAFGVVLVWRGIWDLTASLPIIGESIVALLVGFLILWLLERYTEI